MYRLISRYYVYWRYNQHYIRPPDFELVLKRRLEEITKITDSIGENLQDVSQSNQSSDENNASSNCIATAPKITLLDICVAACLWSLNHLADCFPKAPPSRTQGHSRLMTGRGWKNDGKNLFPKSPVPGFGRHLSLDMQRNLYEQRKERNLHLNTRKSDVYHAILNNRKFDKPLDCQQHSSWTTYNLLTFRLSLVLWKTTQGSSQLNFALSLENLTEEDANYDLFATFRSITQGFQLSPVFI
ncbi:hypothetical protein P5673_016766 [Acropora cervicornis]|uniref:Uncharacterized protein n=1 Tax=Acropora cervicornis TaxID=6130 RepID=A0AAD9QFN5_ACRCE|nr:hypothetical protein P5673_016766 [Acropora cervicornis]